MVGMGRSGTTAISEAIALHEEFGWISVNVEHLPRFPAIALLDRFVFLPGIGLHLRGKKKQKKGLVSFVKKYLPYPSETYSVWERFCGEKFSYDYLIGQTASAKERRQVVEYLKKILRFQGKPRFFAKFTGPPRIHYLNSIFPDAYFIHMIRDPRPVVSSLLNAEFLVRLGWLKKPWWRNGLPDNYVKEWEGTGRSPIALAAVQWKWIVELTWKEKALIPSERFLEVRYENFVKQPHETLRDIFRRVHLSDSAAAHDYISSVGKIENMNFKYKTFLNPKDIALVERITGETAKRAGYDFTK